MQEYDDDSLDPLEQMIRDLWKADSVLFNVFGPYFDWDTEKQGMPFCVVSPSGGDGPNLYDMNQSHVINQVSMRFDVWSDTRASLVNPTTGYLTKISRLFERVHGVVLKGDQACLSALMETRWHTVYEQAKNNALNLNAWHSMAAFRFRVEKRAGVL